MYDDPCTSQTQTCALVRHSGLGCEQTRRVGSWVGNPCVVPVIFFFPSLVRAVLQYSCLSVCHLVVFIVYDERSCQRKGASQVQVQADKAERDVNPSASALA